MKFSTIYSITERKIRSSEKASLTDESFRDECDISLMIEKFRISKIPPRTVNISFGHSPSSEDFANAQMLLAEVKSNFEGLPSSIRDEFDNNVQNYLDYISNKTNLRDCYERGLIDRSSVSLEQVYPERFQQINTPSLTPVQPSVEQKPIEQAQLVQDSVNANS